MVTHLDQIQFALGYRLGTLIVWAGVLVLAIVIGAIGGAAVGRRRGAAFEWGIGGALTIVALEILAFSLVQLLMAFGLLNGLSVFDVFSVGPLVHFNATYGWEMWNPQTYYFDRIPDQVEPAKAIFIVLAAIASSVVGALIPALLAARLNPVEALRYE